MSTSQITCLVTLHGIGFQQPPQPGIENSGYADLLHLHLKTCLGSQLSDDPNRTHRPNHPGENGAIYVQSCWSATQGKASREEGLKRLGKWCDGFQQIDITDAPLRGSNESIAHIALVYSDLEPTGPALSAALATLGIGLSSASHYASALDLLHLALTDSLAVLRHPADSREEPASTRPRTDLRSRSIRILGRHVPFAPAFSSGLLSTLRSLEDDVACYVCYNEERERVRSFVREALVRLALRSDVSGLVLNTHSNGSVIALDALRHLPATAMKKIKAFVTAGSPLRKYVDLFHWGNQIQYLAPIEPWDNFYDPCDPVADPLNPPLSWRPGDEILPSLETLFSRIDPQSEMPCWMRIKDHKVDNVEKSHGEGLLAHNYWDNEEQFVPQLAEIICTAAGAPSLPNAA